MRGDSVMIIEGKNAGKITEFQQILISRIQLDIPNIATTTKAFLF